MPGTWAALIAFWALIAVILLGWAGGELAALLSGGSSVPFGAGFAGDVLQGRWDAAWPGTPAFALVPCIAAVYAAAGGVAVAGWRAAARRRAAPGDPVAALADNPAIRRMTRIPVATRAARLRPTLAGTVPAEIEPGEIGLELGRLMLPGHRAAAGAR